MRMVVVDDKESIRGSVAMLLAMAFPNAEIQEAEDGLKGFNLISDESQLVPAVVVTDYQMPFLTGPDMIEKIRGIRQRPVLQRVPVILMSTESPSQIPQTGWNDYISKPINMPKLVEAIKTLLSI